MGTKEAEALSVEGSLYEPRPARSALSKTGGYLTGYTHTLQPYAGCQFGCSYCYVAELPVHRFHRPAAAWGAYTHPRIGIAERLEKELARLERRGQLRDVAIFMSSATDPYQPAERKWRLSRACLEVFHRYSPARLTIQTRSPWVADDFPHISKLGECVWLSMTLDTNDDTIRRAFAPRSPSVQSRIRTVKAARELGLQVQIAVSPSLPYSSIEEFGLLLCSLADRIMVDTFVSGDGGNGKRSARSAVPEIYDRLNLGEWQRECSAHELYMWLRKRIGGRAMWSQAGFVALAQSARRSGPNAGDGNSDAMVKAPL